MALYREDHGLTGHDYIYLRSWVQLIDVHEIAHIMGEERSSARLTRKSRVGIVPNRNCQDAIGGPLFYGGRQVKTRYHQYPEQLSGGWAKFMAASQGMAGCQLSEFLTGLFDECLTSVVLMQRPTKHITRCPQHTPDHYCAKED
jgi:hypothetical protein